MGLFSLQAAVAKMCLSTSRPLSGPGCVHSTTDKPSSTRLRTIEAESPRPILGSSSGTSVLSVARAAGRAVSDDHLSRNRPQISPRSPHTTAPRITGALVKALDVIVVKALLSHLHPRTERANGGELFHRQPKGLCRPRGSTIN